MMNGILLFLLLELTGFIFMFGGIFGFISVGAGKLMEQENHPIIPAVALIVGFLLIIGGRML